MSVRTLALLLALAASLGGCDGEPPTDAGMDAGADAAARDAARVDAPPPMCMPECGVGQTCCDIAGATGCYDLRNDPSHCGECNVDCVAENRGDGCAAASCTCGSAPLGCSGMREDFCCPARRGVGEPYCANLSTSAADCGTCGRGCNPAEADRCDGGECRCGPGRGPCAGTPDSVCCQEGADVGCVDTTTDLFHCGGCNTLCQSGERCEESSCTRGASCPGGCAEGEICCDGTCCSRRACMAGVCGLPRTDAGTPDAGTPDAGVDAGTPDAGSIDAG